MTTVTTRPTTTRPATQARRRPGTPYALMQIRARINARITAGEYVECRRCHTQIRPGDKWELGHPINAPYASGNKADGLAPEHSNCNKTGLVNNQAPTFPW